MKFFIALFAVAIIGAQALTDEQKAKIKSYHKDCSAVSGVDQAVIQDARSGKFADDPKFKEHLFCFSKKAGFQNDKGEIQESVLRTKLEAELKDAETTNKLMTKCAVNKSSPQQTAFDAIKCYYENTPTHISLA